MPYYSVVILAPQIRAPHVQPLLVTTLLEYGIHTLDRNGLGGLVVCHPSTSGETQVQFLVSSDLKSQQTRRPAFIHRGPQTTKRVYIHGQTALTFSA